MNNLAQMEKSGKRMVEDYKENNQKLKIPEFNIFLVDKRGNIDEYCGEFELSKYFIIKN